MTPGSEATTPGKIAGHRGEFALRSLCKDRSLWLSLLADTSPQSLHQVDYVFAFWSLLRPNGLVRALLIDQLNQGRLFLKFLGLEQCQLFD